jgi:hypothetical protein
MFHGVKVGTLEDSESAIKNVPIDHGIAVNPGCGKSGAIGSDTPVAVEKKAGRQFHMPFHRIQRRP